MANHEQSVREAAANLKKAIEAATSAGYRIAWPGNVAALDTISISETAAAAAKRDPEPDAKPAAVRPAKPAEA